MPSIVQMAVGAATTSLSDPAAAWLGFCVRAAAADVIGGTSPRQRYVAPPGRSFQWPASKRSRETRVRRMDGAFSESVRELLTALASGSEPTPPAGGGLTRVLRQTGAASPRRAVE